MRFEKYINEARYDGFWAMTARNMQNLSTDVLNKLPGITREGIKINDSRFVGLTSPIKGEGTYAVYFVIFNDTAEDKFFITRIRIASFSNGKIDLTDFDTTPDSSLNIPDGFDTLIDAQKHMNKIPTKNKVIINDKDVKLTLFELEKDIKVLKKALKSSKISYNVSDKQYNIYKQTMCALNVQNVSGVAPSKLSWNEKDELMSKFIEAGFKQHTQINKYIASYMLPNAKINQYIELNIRATEISIYIKIVDDKITNDYIITDEELINFVKTIL